jgi:predicted metal-dependent peptidase
MAKISHKDRITQQHIALLRNLDTVWLATICMIGDVIIEKCGTAWTNGRDCGYDPDLLDALMKNNPKIGEAMIRWVIAHENYHKGLQHLIVHRFLVEQYTPMFGEKEAEKLVNLAQDFWINNQLEAYKPFLTPPDGIIDYCLDAKYSDDKVWDTIAIAADLAKNANKAQSSGGGSNGNSGNKTGKNQQSHDKHDWEGAKNISLNKEESEQLSKEIAQALKEGKHLSNKMGGKTPRHLGDLLTPQADWRRAVMDWFTVRSKGHDIITYARPNRRHYGSGLIMPSSYNESMDRLGVFIDMSGSISQDVARALVSEVSGAILVTHPKSVDLLYWDTAVCKHEHYEGEDVYNIGAVTKPEGGGGTAPSCVVRYCEEKKLKFDAVIWLSDGYVGNDWAEDLRTPALWVIIHNGVVPQHLPHIQLPARL